MEVHHHPHVDRKSFKEYLLEGLMIFIAVTMGFFAESLREVITDHERANQYMENMVMSVASDTIELKRTIQFANRQNRGIDSFLTLKRKDISDIHNRNQFYYYVFNYLLGARLFKPNDAAIEQMKSSGAFRLITNQAVIDSIFKYESGNKKILMQEDDNILFYKQLAGNFVKLLDLSEAELVNFTVKDSAGNQLIEADRTLEPITNDALLLKETYNNTSALKIANSFYINNLTVQLSYARRFIQYLKNEYHLKQD
jgi:hypothetical protein